MNEKLKLLAAAILSFCTVQMADANSPFVGSWLGSYTCGQGETALTLEFVEAANGRLMSVFSFSGIGTNSATPSGAFTSYVEVGDANAFVTQPGEWVQRPQGYEMIGLSGRLNPKSGVLSGQIRHPGCSEFSVSRTDSSLSDVALSLMGAESEVAVSDTTAPTQTVPVDSMAGILSAFEGEYGAQLNIGLGQYADYSLSITTDGMILVIDGTLIDCQYVIDPVTGQSYTYGRLRGTCGGGIFTLIDSTNGMTFRLSEWPDPVFLPPVSGPMGEAWVENTPDTARILAVQLGDPIPTDIDAIDGAGTLRSLGSLDQVFPQRGGIGFTGGSNTINLPANYHHVSSPVELPGRSETISFDDTGIFAIEDRVVAILRHHEPPADNAPRYDAVQEAILATYGPPTISDGNRTSASYEWHFDRDGNLYASGEGRQCAQRFTGTPEDSRYVTIRYQTLETSLTEIYAGRAPRIEDDRDVGKLRVAAGCGYTVAYRIRSTDGGLLDRLRAFAYAHDPVRSAIWSRRSDQLAREIETNLERQQNSEAIAPRL